MVFFRRQCALLEWALSSHRKRPGKSLVLAGVLALIVFLLASFAFLRASVRLEAAEMLRDAPDLVVRLLVAGRHEQVPAAAMASIGAVPGVAAVEGRLWGYYYDPLAGANYTVVVPTHGPPAEGEAAIGSAIARAGQRRDRKRLAIRSYRGDFMLFTVRTVLPERADLLAGDVMVVSERDFRRLFDLPGDAVTDVLVRLAPGSDPRAVSRDVPKALPGARAVTRREMEATAASFLDARRGLPAIFVLAMSMALVILASDKPSAMSVEEQQELGILRALGWSPAEVLTAKAWETLALSITSLFVGLLAAYAHVYMYGAALFSPVLRGWSVVMPGLHLVPAFDAPFLAAIAGSVVLLPAFGTVIAALRSASGEPDAVIRD